MVSNMDYDTVDLGDDMYIVFKDARGTFYHDETTISGADFDSTSAFLVAVRDEMSRIDPVERVLPSFNSLQWKYTTFDNRSVIVAFVDMKKADFLKVTVS